VTTKAPTDGRTTASERVGTLNQTGVDLGQEVIYLLGIALATDRRLVVEITEQFPAVRVAEDHGFDVWYVTVDRDQFDGEEAEANLADASWLTPRVLAHQAVLEYFSTRMPLLPMSFGTLYTSLDNLYSTIAPNRARIAEFLSTVRGHSEWGLKCFVAWDAAYDQSQTAQPELLSGSDYLRRKKSIRLRDAHLRQVADAQLRQVVELAMGYSTESVLRRSLAASVDQECVSNLALLVDDQKFAALHDWVNGVNASTGETCIRLELTGPWPAYSFAPSLQLTHEPPAQSNNECPLG
jgi:hypothetical protein